AVLNIFRLHCWHWFSNEEILKDFFSGPLMWAGAGTVADMGELKNENRILVAKGLEAMSRCGREKSFKDSIIGEIIRRRNLATPLTEKDISWVIAPFLNAAGRMGRTDLLVACAETGDKSSLAAEIDTVNELRKKICDELFMQIKQNPQDDRMIFCYLPEIPTGLTGLLAMRLLEEYQKPAVIIGKRDNIYASGSIRSSEEINTTALLTELRHFFLQFGGHDTASGFTIEISRIEEFRTELKNKIGSSSQKTQMEKYYDYPAPLNDFSMSDYKSIMDLAPFGSGNEEPVFLEKEVPVKCVFFGRENRHVKIKAPGSNRLFIGWGLAEKFRVLSGKKIDLLYSLEYDNYRNDLRGLIRQCRISI
ncbi:MAG TPA: hypothetical protein DC049_04070, partial [Spirochaetia bacterium]|nr:hypothetical protein [Spirochaetia bacterium]